MSAMIIRRRRKEISKEASVIKILPSSSPKLIDIWFLRISHLSQFGLFLLTLGTIYFTVIPLYQKAVLEEKIAQKQMQIQEMEIFADALYRKTRNYVVSQFVSKVGFQCTSLSLSPPSLSSFNESDSDWTLVYSPKRALLIEPKVCANNLFDANNDLSELKSEDFKMLKDSLNHILDEIEGFRKEAIFRHDHARKTVEADPYLSDPHNIQVGSLDYLFLRDQSPAKQRDVLFEVAVSKEQVRALSSYEEIFRERIVSLASLSWKDKGGYE